MVLEKFDKVGLEEIQKVSLMKRVDQKFVLQSEQLVQLLKNVADSYYMLEIDSKSNFQYETVYFDTPHDDMYKAHHNGKLNRFKIRHRNYTDSGLGFLELKFKNNKGRTIKTRIPSFSTYGDFTQTEINFVALNSPYSPQNLLVKLQNKFNRITIVDKHFGERCTIDSGITFTSDTTRFSLENTVIIEVKSEKNNTQSKLIESLSQMGIKSSQFSKYCTGRIMTDENVKCNRFKTRVRKMKKNLFTNSNTIFSSTQTIAQ
jgi:hypothetical protein